MHLTHAYVHRLADVHLAGFAPAFTLSLCDSEYARKPPVPIASGVMHKRKKKEKDEKNQKLFTFKIKMFMKKLLSICVFTLLTTLLTAQVSKTVNVTIAGTLSTLLSAEEKKSITNFTVTGNIDARDIKCIRDEINSLTFLDISAVSIQAYIGKDGTYYATYSTTYPVDEMPQYSFYNNSTSLSKSSLKTIILPNNINSIGNYAFRSCGLRGNLTIPNSVTKIGNSAFYYCTSPIDTLTIGSSVTSIGDYAFAWYSQYKVIKCLNPIPPIIGTSALSGVTPAIIYVPSSSVTAYKNATGWSYFPIATENKVTINNPTAGNLAANLISSGYGPLSSITHLTITGNLNSLDISQIKSNMTVLTDIDLSESIISNNEIPNNAFENKTTLITLKLPPSIQIIGDYAFSGCVNLTNEVQLSSIVSLGTRAFKNCSSMSGNLVLPNQITTINPYAFAGCSSLSGSLIIPNNVTSIGTSAFEGCTGFTGNLILSDALITIENSSFSSCSRLSGILRIPQNVTYIGGGTFSGCSNLTELYINKNVAIIGNEAFNNCTSLSKIYSYNSTPPTIYSNTFGGVNKETCSLTVPILATSAYQTANYWSLFIFISEKNFDILNGTNKISESKIKVYASKSEIIVEGTSEGEIVTIFTANGKQIQTVMSKGQRLNLSVDRNTIYLVKTGEKTYKVIL